MNGLVGYSGNYLGYSGNVSKTSGSLWQCDRDEPALTNAGAIANFSVADNSDSVAFKQQITGKTAAGGIKTVEIMMPLKYLNNFWRTLDISLINCEINLTFPVLNLSTQDNAKLLQQLNQNLKEQLIGITVNQKYQYKRQTHI